MNGPTPIGSVPKFVPSFVSWVGDITIPSFVARIWSSGVKRWFRWITTVYGPLAVTEAIGERSLARFELGRLMSRSSEVTTACALNGVPSLNRIPLRSGIV